MQSPLPRQCRALWIVTAAALLLLGSRTSHAQTNLYSDLVTPANPQSGVVQFMQLVDPLDGPGLYTLTSFELGVNFDTGTSSQGVIIEFYTGVDTSPTSANALANATYVGGTSGTLTAPGGSGNYTYTFTLTSPLNLPTPNGAFGVEFLLTNGGSDFSTDVNGRFTATAPTVGTGPGYVWNDSNDDGIFEGSEQTNFGQGAAYVRFSMGGTFAPAPEPGTWAILATGLGVLALAVRHQRRVA